MTVLAADGLSRHFDGVRALEDVSLSVAQGEIVGLIGPNGSGKTTMLNVLTGVLRPTAGRVRLDGEDLTGWRAHRVARRGLGRTFQNIRLYRDLTVHENVLVAALAARRRGDVRGRTDALLAGMGLAEMAGRRASTLPYGSQRRLEVTRALALDPLFLLLDEPAAGLNQQESDALLATLAGIRDDRGCGILVIDHDMRLIMRLCERIHVLDAGRSLFEGTPAQVRRSPAVAEAYLGEARA